MSNKLDKGFGMFESGIGAMIAHEARAEYLEKINEGYSENTVSAVEYDELVNEFNSLLFDYKQQIDTINSLIEKVEAFANYGKEKNQEIEILKKKLSNAEINNGNMSVVLSEVNHDLNLAYTEDARIKKELHEKTVQHDLAVKKINFLNKERSEIGKKAVERIGLIRKESKAYECASKILLVRSQFLNNIVGHFVAQGVITLDQLDKNYQALVSRYNEQQVETGVPKLTVDQMRNWLNKNCKSMSVAIEDVVQNKVIDIKKS